MKAFVTPRPDRVVLQPGLNLPVPACGMEVEYTAHWQRRGLDGDVDVRLIPDAAAQTKVTDQPAPAAAATPHRK